MKSATRRQRGMTLIELLVSLTLLAVILSALLPLVLAAIAENNRNRTDSASTMLSQQVLDAILEQSATTSPVIQMTDCAGNVRNVNTAGPAGAAPPPAFTGAPLVANGSAIDWTVAFAVNGGYSMYWTTCGAGVASGGANIANQTGSTYEVRWNIQNPTAFTKLVTVSARPIAGGAAANVNRANTIAWQPVSLRAIGGQ